MQRVWELSKTQARAVSNKSYEVGCGKESGSHLYCIAVFKSHPKQL